MPGTTGSGYRVGDFALEHLRDVFVIDRFLVGGMIIDRFLFITRLIPLQERTSSAAATAKLFLKLFEFLIIT